ncbi:hypothetical protein [Amycolatopsis sp. GA6-003]|uniref:hypothetical protein n=1 Tax=Amycolatopsis sp. GA6-003 TaxID=2652444 RepID=UPI0039171033
MDGIGLLVLMFLTVGLATTLMTGDDRLDAAWEERPSFRRVWRRLTVAWGVGSLVHSGLSIGMAYRLPVDDVPAPDAGLSIAFFVGLQVLTQILLLREGTLRQVLRPSTVD